MLLYNSDITPPKYWSSGNYNPNYYLGESYEGIPSDTITEGYETIDELIEKMDNLRLNAAFSKRKLIYDDSEFDDSSFDLSDIDEARDLALAEQMKMSKPNDPLPQPSNNSPLGGGAGLQISGATTTSGESTDHANEA